MKCVKAYIAIRKTKQTGDVDSDGNPVELSDIDKESIADTGDGGATVSQMETPKKRQKKVKVEKGIALAEKASTKESQDERMNTVQGVAAEIKEEIKEELTASKEKPKTVRKRTPKKVAKEAEPETGGEPGGQNDNIQEKTKTVRQKTPKKATKDVKKPTAADQDGPTMQEISKQVAEEIEAKMEDEAGVVIHQPEEVKKLPLKRRGRSSQAKQLV